MGENVVTPNQSISDAEREVMKTLWELQRATVREIREHLAEGGREWAHTTINTLLGRMEQKGLVDRDTTEFAHIYVPAASRTALVQQRLVDLADEYCDGESAPLMLALVENGKFTEEEIAQFRRLVDQLEKKSSTRGGHRKGRRSRR